MKPTTRNALIAGVGIAAVGTAVMKRHASHSAMQPDEKVPYSDWIKSQQAAQPAPETAEPSAGASTTAPATPQEPLDTST